MDQGTDISLHVRFYLLKKMARGRSPAGLKYKPLTTVLRMQVTLKASTCSQCRGIE